MNKKNKLLVVSLIVVFFLLLVSACDKVSINLILDANGGEFEDANNTYVIKTDGASKLIFPTNPTKEGYLFDGWYFDKDSWEQPFNSNSLLISSIQNDLTVYAKWTNIITYETNGGSLVTATRKDYGESIQAPSDPTKKGFTFEGWYTDNWTFLNEYVFITMPNENITIYAKWLLSSDIDSLVYAYVQNAYKVTGYNGAYSEVIIPIMYNSTNGTHPVIGIGDDAFLDCASLTSITIPDSIISIGESVFQGCTSLTSITIPDNVISIGNNAFFNCTSLTNITIGNSVISIGESAFQGCTSLTSITISDSVISIGKSAFQGCSRLTSIIISANVISIGKSAFQGCSRLTSIIISDNATSIGESAFQDCTSLISITLENETLPSIGNMTLSNTHSTLKIYVPSDSVETYKSTSGWSNYADRIYAIED